MNCELLNDDYVIFRKDRESRRAGGVLIAIRANSFTNVQQYIHETSQDEELEIVAVVVVTSQQKVLICSCYRPPDFTSNWIDTFNTYLSRACDLFDNVVICGDFNLPDISWDNTIANKTNGHPFIEVLNDHFLTQVNNFPTRGDNILDLLITSVPEHVTITQIETPENAAVFTDHSVVFYELNAFVTIQAKTRRYVYDYGKGDFEGLRSALSAKNLCSNLDHEDINDDWQSWKNTFLQTVSKYDPCKKIKGRNPLPWITGNILNLINKKNTVRRKLKSCPTSHLAQKFKGLRTSVKNMLRESLENYFTSLGNNFKQNPKRLWSIIKNKSKSRNIPNTVSSAVNSGTNQDPARFSADNPTDIANMFNRYFTSVYTSADNYEDTADHEQAEPAVMTDLALSVEEVQAVLGSLDCTKATGPDGIPARLLKETASVISPSLCKLYNKSLEQGIFPQDWKLANIVPIYKKGQREHTENYRPISLLPILSKVLERCVFFNIKDHLFQLIQKLQHGFISGKSCVTNLLEVLDYIGSELDNGG